jgi:two-component system nitrate/nitrite response regulator NarL
MVPIQRTTTGSVNSIRIIIADQRAAFRQTLRTLLALETDLTIVGEASDAKSISVLARQLQPDVIIMDAALFYRLGYLSGTQFTFKTVVMVSRLQRDDIIKAFLRGARAVVPKTSHSHIWCNSVRTVGAGQYWLVDESIALLVEALLEHFPQEAELRRQNAYRLTPREVEIVDKIAQGHSNKEVGLAFSIREKTVKHHLTSIFTKVGVSSRLELALFALNHQLQESLPSARTTLAEVDRHPSRRGKLGAKGIGDI